MWMEDRMRGSGEAGRVLMTMYSGGESSGLFVSLRISVVRKR